MHLRQVLVAFGCVLLMGLSGCGDETDGPERVLAPESGERPAIFEPGQVVYAQRSTIHVGDETFDVAPQIVTSIDWTPYGVFLELTDDLDEGPFTHAFYDGTTMTPIKDVSSGIVISPDGELAAWIDMTGPERPAGRVARLVVVRVRTGEVVYTTADGMGGEKGDDLGDPYEELPPGVTELTDDTIVWRNSTGAGESVTTNLETGRSTYDEDYARPTTSGYAFRSPDGTYRVDANTTGRLRVKPRQPDFGHRFQTHAGWLGGHTLLALGQDRYGFFPDARRPDKLPGWILACDLAKARCDVVERIVGARDTVFSGIDVDP